jgi:hypothetical protein
MGSIWSLQDFVPPVPRFPCRQVLHQVVKLKHETDERVASESVICLREFADFRPSPITSPSSQESISAQHIQTVDLRPPAVQRNGGKLSLCRFQNSRRWTP